MRTSNEQPPSSPVQACDSSSSTASAASGNAAAPMARSQSATSSSTRVCLEDYNFASNVTRSYLLWISTTVEANMSNRAAEACQKQFSSLFPDSKIAKTFSVGKHNRCKWLGSVLYPTWKARWMTLFELFHVYISFDEALNKVVQKTKLDIHNRYQDQKSFRIISRFFTSQFLLQERSSLWYKHRAARLRSP